MKPILLFLLLAMVFGCDQKQPAQSGYPISPVQIKNVELTDNFWLPKIKVIQDSTIQYAFDKCNEEGRMENFLIAGGQKPGPVRGKMPFDDTDLYKIIEGASNTLISQPNPKLESYLDSIISIIKTGQEPDGYLTTWFTIDRKNPPASWAHPSEKRWEFEESNHELYNSGHLFEAAAVHYFATGKQNFLDIALKNADLLVASFGPGKVAVPPGHQIVETGLIKLYQITHKKEYLDLAKYFLELRGDSATHKLYGEYSQDHLAVTEQTEAVGHAVRAEYMYAAMTDIAAIDHDPAYLKAINSIWENIVAKKMYLTGGVGSLHGGEAFGANYELPNKSAYNETCAAIGSVYFNHRLFLLTGHSKYYDIIERTLYNGLIAGISLTGKEFFYPNPLESDGHYRFNQGACTRKSWFDCSCCPTNVVRFVPSIPGLIYATHNDSLFVNLFMSNKAEVLIGNKKVEVSQQTGYPFDGKVSIAINPGKKSKFSVKIRVPGWAENVVAPGNLYSYGDEPTEKAMLKVNGKEEPASLVNGYFIVTKIWEPGDNLEIDLPMKARKVMADAKVAEDNGKVAFEMGPIVYCAEEADNGPVSDLTLPENISFQTQEKTIATETFTSLKGLLDGKEFTLIPYYLWSNRGIGEMKVWFPQNK